MMCTGSSCEGEISPKSLSKATAEESLLSVSKFGAATGQPDTRQKQVRLIRTCTWIVNAIMSSTSKLLPSSVVKVPKLILFISCFRFDVSSTVAELEQILLLPPPPPSLQRESIDGCGFSKAAKSPATKSTRSGVRGSGGTPAKRKLFKNEGKEQKHGGKGILLLCTCKCMQNYHMQWRLNFLLHISVLCTCIDYPLVYL